MDADPEELKERWLKAERLAQRVCGELARMHLLRVMALVNAEHPRPMRPPQSSPKR